MFALLGSFMNSPFDIVQAPNEIPIGPPTEHHSSYLATLQTNRSIFPVAKLILFVNLFFGGASSMVVVLFKAFLLYLWPAFVGVVFPRYRTEQSISWFLKVPTVVGIAAIIFFV
jgi:NADH-quinone oxidoreductase subunit H